MNILLKVLQYIIITYDQIIFLTYTIYFGLFFTFDAKSLGIAAASCKTRADYKIVCEI